LLKLALIFDHVLDLLLYLPLFGFGEALFDFRLVSAFYILVLERQIIRFLLILFHQMFRFAFCLKFLYLFFEGCNRFRPRFLI
jgi:hypothetical protein